MNLKRILLSSVAAVTLTSVAAFADGTNATPVTLEQDGTGDYLVLPAYFANSSGWSTNLKVVNTNVTAAVVAKVVIRENITSTEKLDFPIYLSPGDVWEGTISYANGNVVLTSADDSMYASGSGATSVFADAAPITKALATGTSNTMGYVEVFGIAALPGTNAALGGSTWTSGPIAKYKIRDAYLDDLNNHTGTVTTSTRGEWVPVVNSDLYAQEVISANNGSGNLAMTLPAIALGNVTGGVVVAETVGKETTLTNSSERSDKGVLLTDMEAAIAKSNVYVTHYEDVTGSAMAETVLLMTQPMKKYRGDLADDSLETTLGYDQVVINTTARTGTNDTSGTLSTAAYAGLAHNNYAFRYTATSRDQSENTPTVSLDQYSGFYQDPTVYRCNTELCYLNVAASGMSAYAKGWVDVNVLQGLTDSETTKNIELPVIPSVMTAKNIGGTNVTNIIYPTYK